MKNSEVDALFWSNTPQKRHVEDTLQLIIYYDYQICSSWFNAGELRERRKRLADLIVIDVLL
jgi:hypothetical protein